MNRSESFNEKLIMDKLIPINDNTIFINRSKECEELLQDIQNIKCLISDTQDLIDKDQEKLDKAELKEAGKTWPG